MTRKKRLGRGLEALLNSTNESPASETTVARDPGGMARLPQAETQLEGAATAGSAAVLAPRDPVDGGIVHLNVYEIEDNPYQPRSVFNEIEIASLAESLKEHDILQPILVRVVNGQYQLISGERRLRAAIKANWTTIPARLREADDRLVSELAIVENLQRKDLNPVEKALCFKRYIIEHSCTQEELANRLKIDRSTVANLMRLLELPEPIKEALQTGTISAGHARALLPLGDEQLQIDFCDEIVREGLSVRATERSVSDKIAAEDRPQFSSPKKPARTRDHQIESIQLNLKHALGTKVVIKQGARQKGQIVVHFANHEEFERLCAHLASGNVRGESKVA